MNTTSREAIEGPNRRRRVGNEEEAPRSAHIIIFNEFINIEYLLIFEYILFINKI